MKIRTITTGFPYHPTMTYDEFSTIAHFLKDIKQEFIKKGYKVQTIRMCTQPWYTNVKTKDEFLAQADRLYQWIYDHQIDYFSTGPITKADQISWASDIIETIPNIFCTVPICGAKSIDYDAIHETAEIILKNATLESKGFANLRFAALCNIQPHTPFFPASYHSNTPPSFSIGLENSDLVYQAFKKAGSIKHAQQTLHTLLTETYKPIESLAMRLSEKHAITYDGIDVSISTSIKQNESIAYGFEHLQPQYQFGNPGTLSIAKIITDTLHAIPIKKTGYNGLMLPVLEDHGLATRNKEHRFSITNLLLYSAVCGTGLDTIPLPGSITVHEIEHILMDVASLSIKLQKPLSARLMPIPGKTSGDLTEFSFSYFKNSIVMNQRT